MESSKDHWNGIYREKPSTELSWYEPVPETSLSYVEDCRLDKSAAIIDVGGGDSFFTEFLLAKGYTDLTVLDISEKALQRVKQRLEERAEEIKWIVSDASEFQPQQHYDFWHDRASFHFLTGEQQVKNYLNVVNNALRPGGLLVIGTFSETGPERCSGLPVKRYSMQELQDVFRADFDVLGCKKSTHITGSGKSQDFLFCSFQKKKN